MTWPRRLPLLLALLMLFSATIVCAQDTRSSERLAGRMIGRVVKSQGEILAVGERGRLLKAGMRVYEKDEIHTGNFSGLVIALVDESTLTLGADTACALEKFTYKRDAEIAELRLVMRRGAIRVVASKLGYARPLDTRLETPGASVETSANEFWAGFFKPEIFDALLISGKSLTVSNRAGSQTITRHGYGVTVASESAAPSKPAEWKQDKRERAYRAVEIN